jgi:hypothetical protein
MSTFITPVDLFVGHGRLPTPMMGKLLLLDLRPSD